MKRPCRQRGFALVAVLWILVAVGAVGISFQAGARAERRAIANVREGVRGRWAARAGLARALRLLDSTIVRGQTVLTTDPATAMVVPPVSFDLDGMTVTAWTFDARARVNLNAVGARDFVQLLRAAGVAPDQAAGIAAAVMDWRDPDDMDRGGGRESDRYGARRPPSRPGNRPFHSVDELRDVVGVTAEFYERMAPFLTVAGDGRINVNSAPIEVLVTLPGMDQRGAAALTARRRGWTFRSVYELVSAMPRSTQARLEAELATFTDRVAFYPRGLEVVVAAGPAEAPRAATMWAEVELVGGTVWSVTRAVER